MCFVLFFFLENTLVLSKKEDYFCSQVLLNLRLLGFQAALFFYGAPFRGVAKTHILGFKKEEDKKTAIVNPN